MTKNEIAHLWANKAKSPKNHTRNSSPFSFEGEYIYSYRTKIGKYSHNTDFVLLNTHMYSNTTVRHQRSVKSSVRYSKTIEIDCTDQYYESSDNTFNADNILRAFNNTYESIAEKLAKATKPQKYVAEFSKLIHNVAVYNDYLKACQELQLTADDEHATEEQFAELNELYIKIKTIIESPDAKKGIQTYLAEKEAKEKEKWERVRKEYDKRIKCWKNHERDDKGNLITAPQSQLQIMRGETDFVRLSKDGLFFETHRGAIINKSEGLALFRILTGVVKEKTQSTFPMSIGSYRLDYIDPNGDCKIGCHRFTYKEFEAVNKGLKNKQENETLKIN